MLVNLLYLIACREAGMFDIYIIVQHQQISLTSRQVIFCSFAACDRQVASIVITEDTS